MRALGMTHRMWCRASVALVGVLGGCANHQDYAVLLPRAVEQTNAPDAPTPVHVAHAPAPASAEQRARIATARSDALAGITAYQKLRTERAQRLADTRASPEHSEAWFQRQQALGELEAARRPIVAAQSALDAMYIDAVAGDGTGLAEIRAARNTVVAAMHDAQIPD